MKLFGCLIVLIPELSVQGRKQRFQEWDSEHE